MGVIFHCLRLNINILENIWCFKCFLKYLYQLVFKFEQFLDFKFTYFPKYCQFCDFDPFWVHFLAFGPYFSLFEAKYKYLGKYGVLQMFFILFVPIGFQVWPIFRLQIDIFSNILPIFFILTPFWVIFGPLGVIFGSLELDINILAKIRCFKCFLKYFYQLFFKFDQFLDSKLTYFPKYCQFCDFDPIFGAYYGPLVLFFTL